jgi:hypothetical protein
VAFSAQPPGLRRLSLGRESFAAACPLALLGSASYPVSVRRLTDSLPASFSPPLPVGALRFTWIVTTNSPEDFHPQVTSHAGHTNEEARPPSAGLHSGDAAPFDSRRFSSETGFVASLRATNVDVVAPIQVGAPKDQSVSPKNSPLDEALFADALIRNKQIQSIPSKLDDSGVFAKRISIRTGTYTTGRHAVDAAPLLSTDRESPIEWPIARVVRGRLAWRTISDRYQGERSRFLLRLRRRRILSLRIC